MHKFILEVCDGNRGSLSEPVFLENALDLPMGVKQAVEDFIDAHAGEIQTPLVVTARMESDDDDTSLFSFVDELQPSARTSPGPRRVE